jgi:hypothetical protein
VSDFVHNLVRRAAGLVADVSVRPPYQPSFAPELPTARRPAAPPGATATSPAQSPPDTVRLHQPEMATATVSPVDEAGVTAPFPPDAGADVAQTLTQSPPAENVGSQTPVIRQQRVNAGHPPQPQTKLPMLRPSKPVLTSQSRTTSGEQVEIAQPSPPSPRPELPEGRSLQSTPTRPSPGSAPTQLPVGNQVAPWPPTDTNVIERPVPRSQSVFLSDRSPVPSESPVTQPATVELGAPLRAKPMPTPSTDRESSSRAPLESAPPLVRPAPPPPPRRPVVRPFAPPPATLSEASTPVQVRIGTVEVRASRPAPPALPRPRPQPLGFDDYAHLRGLEWERERYE